jgi:putative ABC transport system permease protein
MLQADRIRQAVVQGTRWLFRRPLASATAITCLAVGLAASTASWVLIDAVLLRPFGLRDSDRLVVLWEADLAKRQDLIEVSHLNFLDWQRQAQTVDSMAAFGSSHWPALARIGDETVMLATRGVTASFFSTLGVRPFLGHDFASVAAADDVPSIVLSHRFWQSRLAGAQDVVGRSMFVDGSETRIIGVMPCGFAYPDDPDVWTSVEQTLGRAFAVTPIETQRWVGVLEVLARRRATASLEEVRAELTAIVASIHREHGSKMVSPSAVATPFADLLVGKLGPRLWIALGMAGTVFLFACANIAAVRLAQLRERASELTTRRFLGAGRATLAVALAAEQVPLVVAGAATAWLLWGALATLLASTPAIADSGIAVTEAAVRTPAIIGGLAVLAWVLVAVVPAWASLRRSDHSLTMPGTRVARRTSRASAPILCGQTALGLVVVALAGSALEGFQRLSRTDVGFDLRGVTLVDVAVPDWRYPSPAARRALGDRMSDALRQMSGVEHVAAVSVRPFRFGAIVDGLPVRRAGDANLTPDEATAASRVVVTADYFAALGQPIVAGRAFDGRDRDDSETVAVISETLARTLWGNEPAIGKRVETFTLSEKWRARLVIGVAGDAKYRGLERPSMELYVPHTQSAAELGSFVIATPSPVGPTRALLHEALRDVDPEIAIERVQTTSDLVQGVLSPARLLAVVTGALGSAGLLLLALGIFGAVVGALRGALTEIAIRQALGAMPFAAARAPLGILARAVLAGTFLGLALTPALLGATAALGLTLGDGAAVPLALGGCAVLGAAVVASGPSVWRASRSSPADLLRES